MYRFAGWFLVLWLSTHAAPVLQSAALAQSPDSSSETVAPSEPANPQAADADQQERLRRTADITFILLVLVILLSVFLIAAVMIGGRIARRMGRSSVPPPDRVDPLWHLRNPEGSKDAETKKTSPPEQH